MRSLAHELAVQRTGTQPRHETWTEGRNHSVSWDAPGPWDRPSHPGTVNASRRAVLRRALRQGLLRPADGRQPSLRSSRMGEAGKADLSSGARRLESL